MSALELEMHLFVIVEACVNVSNILDFGWSVSIKESTESTEGNKLVIYITHANVCVIYEHDTVQN